MVIEIFEVKFTSKTFPFESIQANCLSFDFFAPWGTLTVYIILHLSSLLWVLFMFFVLSFFHWSIFRLGTFWLYLLILPTSLFVTKIIDAYNDKGKEIDYYCCIET